MIEKIRKSLLCAGFIAAIIITVLLVETGKFETGPGIAMWASCIGYMALFTVANKR